MPAVGSSRNSTSGSCCSASASARRCCSPPDICAICRSSLSSSPTRAAISCRARRDPVVGGVQLEHLAHVRLLRQRRGLQLHADARPQPRELARARGVEPQHAHRARRRLAQPDAAFQRRRLAGAVAAEQPEDRAARDGEAERVDGGERRRSASRAARRRSLRSRRARVELRDQLRRCNGAVRVLDDAAIWSQSGRTSSRTPTQPRTPTYGGRKNRSGSAPAIASARPRAPRTTVASRARRRDGRS